MNIKLIKKFFLFSYGNWIGLVISFFTTMITTRILNPDDFGKASMFILVLNITMYFILFGTDQSFIRFFYEEKEDRRNKLLYNCLILPTLLSAIVALILLILYRQISYALFNEINFTVILFLVIGIIAQVYYRFAILVIRMQQKANLFSIMEIISKILYAFLIIGLYFVIGRSYELIIYSTVITNIILLFILFVSEKSFWKINRWHNKSVIHTKKEIIKYGAPLAFAVLLSWLFQSFDKIAIRHWSNLTELGLYAAAFKIIALLNIFQTTFTTFWTPIALEKFHETSENKSFFSYVSKIVSFVMLLMAVLTIAFKDIIVSLLGKNYIEAADIMPFLVFMPIMYTMSEVTVIGINFHKKTRWHIYITLLICMINIVGNVIMVPRYGAIGASFATAISYIIFFILRTKISLMYFKVDYGLKKIFLSLTIVFLYAMVSIKIVNHIHGLVLGIIILIVHIYNYKNELRSIYDLLSTFIYLKKH